MRTCKALVRAHPVHGKLDTRPSTSLPQQKARPSPLRMAQLLPGPVVMEWKPAPAGAPETRSRELSPQQITAWSVRRSAQLCATDVETASKESPSEIYPSPPQQMTAPSSRRTPQLFAHPVATASNATPAGVSEIWPLPSEPQQSISPSLRRIAQMCRLTETASKLIPEGTELLPPQQINSPSPLRIPQAV